MRLFREMLAFHALQTFGGPVLFLVSLGGWSDYQPPPPDATLVGLVDTLGGQYFFAAGTVIGAAMFCYAVARARWSLHQIDRAARNT